MRIAVLSTHPLWPPHLETELELMQRHLNQGDIVEQFVCDAGLPICDQILDRAIDGGRSVAAVHVDTCTDCIARRKNGQSLLNGSVVENSLWRFSRKYTQEINSLKTDFSDLHHLKSFEYKGFDLGMAVASSIISLTRNPHIDINEYRDVIISYIRAALGVYLGFCDILQETKYDVVYLFNGRFAITRAILRACQQNSVQCLVHERGCDINHYSLYDSVLPHEAMLDKNLFQTAWDAETDHKSRVALANRFYTERRMGIEQSWFSFTNHQVTSLLPESWRHEQRNIVVFTSSEDEFSAIGDCWKNPIFNSQFVGLLHIINNMSWGGATGRRLWIRLHPNLRNAHQQQVEELLMLSGKGVEIIAPDSLVSSYAMLDASTAVLTFGSTMGIEATFWQKPSILAGMSAYHDLGSTYNPRNPDELIELLSADLGACATLGALQYGYYLKTFGEPFVYFKGTGIKSGLFNGQSLDEANPKDRNYINRITRHLTRKLLKYKVRSHVFRDAER